VSAPVGAPGAIGVLVFELFLIAAAIALDPLPLTAYVLVLASKRGVRKGAAFLFGWLVSLAAVVAITLAITRNHPPKPNTAPSIAALAVKIALGAGLVLIGLRQRRRMARPKPPKKPPRWQASIDTMSPWFAMGLAPLLQPWGLIGAGVATIVEAKLSSAASFVVLFLYAVLATSTYIAMELYTAFRPESSRLFLVQLRNYIDTHTDQMIVIGALFVGFWLIGDSIYILVT
jgi:Sap, sulfolipid-1-addressing protein